jgi:prepilin-type processing-associated H-X9-DG protein
MPDLVPAHEVKMMNTGKTINFHNRPEHTGGISMGFADGHIEKITRFEYTVETVQEKTPPKEGIKINPSGSEIR